MLSFVIDVSLCAMWEYWCARVRCTTQFFSTALLMPCFLLLLLLSLLLSVCFAFFFSSFLFISFFFIFFFCLFCLSFSFAQTTTRKKAYIFPASHNQNEWASKCTRRMKGKRKERQMNETKNEVDFFFNKIKWIVLMRRRFGLFLLLLLFYAFEFSHWVFFYRLVCLLFRNFLMFKTLTYQCKEICVTIF